jgi:branched-chain amino acid transport system substrate-binding protein
MIITASGPLVPRLSGFLAAYIYNRRLLLLLGPLLSGLFNCPLPASAEEGLLPGRNGAVRIGAVASLSGAAERNGRNWLEGAELAVDELNAGKEGAVVELIVEDDATVTSKAATAFVKLVTVDKVDGIIGGTWDFLAETLYPLALRYRVPFITPTNPIEILSTHALKNDRIYTNGLSLAAEAEALQGFLKAWSSKKAALIYIEVPYGTSHAALFKTLAKPHGIEVVGDYSISYQGFHDDIKMATLKAARAGADLVFVVLNYEGLDLVARELAVQRSSAAIVSTYTLHEALEFTKDPGYYRRSFGIFPRYTSREFEKAFRERYGRLPRAYAGAGYDAVMFLMQLTQAEKNGTKAFVYKGVTGVHVYPPESRSVAKTEAVIMRATKGGRLVEYRP